jgi:hypothetical protein
MSKFKAGDRIRITANPSENCKSMLRVGDIGIIDGFYLNGAGEEVSASMTCDSHVIGCFHNLGSIELLKPKWTIYNNTLPWSELSDKQKGKLLLARHQDVEIILEGDTGYYAWFHREQGVYKAIKPEPVKPELTMAELFVIDWHETDVHLLKDFSEHMIAKGWVKK